jgi:hypothetical protein
VSREVAELLERAMRLIEKPEAWTRREYARNATGAVVGPGSPDATCWCALGAVAHVGNSPGGAWSGGAWSALNRAAESTGHGRSVAVYLNDNGTHADVLDMFRRAIAAERAERGDT